MRRTLTAVPEPETTLGGGEGGTGHMTTPGSPPADPAAVRRALPVWAVLRSAETARPLKGSKKISRQRDNYPQSPGKKKNSKEVKAARHVRIVWFH